MNKFDADAGLSAMESIISEFTNEDGSKLSESDTRAKLITRVLREVLGWPETAIKREENTEAGRLDYRLVANGTPRVVVEAKAKGVAFKLPISDRDRKSFKISGALSTDRNTDESIVQARGYCDAKGIRYGIATNGTAWVIFRAIRDDGKSWRDGDARVFLDLEHIKSRFTDFWNLLSFHAVSAGSLDMEFSSSIRASRLQERKCSRKPSVPCSSGVFSCG